MSRILIDSQYREIYNGEFKEWVENQIIASVDKDNNYIVYPKTLEEAKNILDLSSNEFDLVIITGYDATLLKHINSKRVRQVACIIYDMNAEAIINDVDDDGYLSDIIVHKSQLIFLSTYVLCYTQSVLEDVKSVYSAYPEINLNSKAIAVDILYKPNNDANTDYKRLVKQKYYLIPESINGITFLTQEFALLLYKLISEPDNNLNFVIVSDNFPKSVYQTIKDEGLSDRISIFNDVTKEDFANLSHYAIATLFLSPLDTNLYRLLEAMSAQSVCLVNIDNSTMMGFYPELLNFSINFEDNFIEDIKELQRMSGDVKQQILAMQNLKLDELSKKNIKSIFM